MIFDWSDLVFGKKSAVNDLHATFIAASRSMSAARFTQLVKKYLPVGNIVLGLAKEQFVLGLEGEPQFAMLEAKAVQPVVNKVNKAKTEHKIYVLQYAQRDLPFILDKVKFKKTVFVNGSWYTALHFRPEYYVLTKKQLPYELVSPFASEQEAQKYATTTSLPTLSTKGIFSEREMLELANHTAKHSYDYSGFQTAAVLAKKDGKGYRTLAVAHNKVVPFETYAMHYGAAKEQNFSAANDLNHFDTIHAEVRLMLAAVKDKLNLAGTTLFINLLPCPSCSKMIAESDIAEVVYQQDHSAGYGVKLLESSTKIVRRVVL